MKHTGPAKSRQVLHDEASDSSLARNDFTVVHYRSLPPSTTTKRQHPFSMKLPSQSCRVSTQPTTTGGLLQDHMTAVAQKVRTSEVQKRRSLRHATKRCTDASSPSFPNATGRRYDRSAAKSGGSTSPVREKEEQEQPICQYDKTHQHPPTPGTFPTVFNATCTQSPVLRRSRGYCLASTPRPK